MSRQKTEGNQDDVVRVVRNIKDGLVWEHAKHKDSFMMVEDEWYERNKKLFLQYAETGIPVPPDNITNVHYKPAPISTIVVGDKVYGVFRNVKGELYREEILAVATPAPTPASAPVAAKTPEKKKEW